MNEAIPAVERRGKPKTMREDVLDVERKLMSKKTPNPLDHRG